MKLNAKSDHKLNDSKVYSCEAIPNTNARSDFLSYEPKSDFHGIGYKSMAEENESSNSKLSGVSAVFKSGRKLQISGEAFGYGVLDEDNEDDAVVYHRDDMSQYDFEIGSLKSEKKKIKDKRKEMDILKGDIIDGFTKGSGKINLFENIRIKYPLPVVPKGWKKSSSDANKPRKSRWDQSRDGSFVRPKEPKNDDTTKTKAPVLNANVRAVLLGEEVIHKHGIKKVEPEPKVKELKSLSPVQEVHQRKVEAFVQRPLTGFWANKFTRSSDGAEQSAISGGLTEFKLKESVNVDKNEEKKISDEKNRTVERTTYEWHPHNLLCKRFNIPNPFPQYSDFVGIVSVGKTDVRNRTSLVNDKKAKPNIFECLFDQKVMSNSNVDLLSDANVSSNKVTEEKKEIGKHKEPEEDNERDDDKENEETNRPPMDLFKAIFASDEESDGDDIEEDKNKNKNTPQSNVWRSEKDQNDNVGVVDDSDSNNGVNTLNNENALKKAGVFANIDFDQLNRDFNPVLKTNESQDSVMKETQSEKRLQQISENSKQEEPSDDYYGPALPPDLSLCASGVSLSSLSYETKSKPSKRKKKEKKHKKHKKHKIDHKKHKRRHRTSSESDSSGSIDIEQEILTKLKSARSK